VKGILFKPDMIRAIVDGRKTVTRRLAGLKEINQEPDKWMRNSWQESQMWCRHFDSFWFDHINLNHQPRRLEIKPRYQVGEVVYIKEAWRITSISDDFEELFINYGDGFENWKEVPDNLAMYYYNHYFKAQRRPSTLFMPAWAARYFIKIAGVGAKRLQELSPDDCIAEGISKNYTDTIGEHSKSINMLIDEYLNLWDLINKGYPSKSNPYVFRYKFGLTSVGAMK